MTIIRTALTAAVLAVLPIAAASAAPGPSQARTATIEGGVTAVHYNKHGNKHGGHHGKSHHRGKGGHHGYYKRPPHRYAPAYYPRHRAYGSTTRYVSRNGCRVRVVERTRYGKRVRVVNRCGYPYW
ncbi:hypothetical protein [Acuticoccus sediminis]|nr:hypothetical protein [Acuticoccus sediminis]